jgi:hypothetical protein
MIKTTIPTPFVIFRVFDATPDVGGHRGFVFDGFSWRLGNFEDDSEQPLKIYPAAPQ